MYIIQPEHQRSGRVLFTLVDCGAIQGHGAAWKGVTNEPGWVPTRDQKQTIFSQSRISYQQCNPFGAPARNGALLYAQRIRLSAKFPSKPAFSGF